MGRQQAALAILLCLLLAVPVAAQQRTCRQVLPSDFRRLVNSRGQETLYFRDPVRVLCTGGVRLEADSAVLNRAAGNVELIGDVVYQDSVRRLRAEWANYLGRADQLLARESAVIEDRENGAVIRGEQLNYLRATETRSEARLIVTGGRPHAVLPPRRADTVPEAPGPAGADRPAVARPEAPDSAAAGPRRSPEPDSAAMTHVWGERLELRGEVFTAQGDVELERGALTGSARRVVYDQPLGRMRLSGDSRLRNETYELSGDEIDAMLEDQDVREILARGRARAASDELEVRSERIRIGFTDGVIDGLEAWNEDPEAERIRASARDFLLRADSLEARADSIGIDQLRAVGRAYGQRQLSTTAAGPRQGPTGLVHDWIQGDTILGFFGRVAAPTDSVPRPGDDAGPERVEDDAGPERVDGIGREVAGVDDRPDTTRTVLERIEVIGGAGSALSFYRMEPEEGSRPAMNFMKATRIVLFMEAGDVARVEAVGPIEGLYLDPGRGTVEEEEDEADAGGAPEGDR